MKTTNKKSKLITIFVATVLLLSVMTSIKLLPTTIPTASAHSPAWNIPTWAYIEPSLNPVGVGQTTLIVMWLDCVSPTATGSGGALFQGYTITVTAPDGTNSTLGPFTSSQEGTYTTEFTPNQVGNYTMVFNYPGQIMTNGTGVPNPQGVAYVGDYFEPSTSTPMTLNVQSTPISSWTESPLPTSYWTLPINSANRGWSVLASNFLKGGWLSSGGGAGEYQNEGTSPTTAHVLWQEPELAAYPGGILDAQWPGVTSDSVDYITPFTAPIIMNGILYMNDPSTENTPGYGYFAWSLYTGQQLWSKNGTDNGLTFTPGYMGNTGALKETYPTLAFGQLFHYYSLNGEGIDTYLWLTQSGTATGTNWYMLDASTGNWIMTLTGVPSGTQVMDQQGDILLYSFNAATGNFLCWNSTQAIPFQSPGTSTDANQWRPRVGATVSATNDQTWLQTGLPLGSSANTGGGYWTVADEYHSGYSMNVTQPELKGLNPSSITAVITDDQRVPREIFGWTFTGPGYSESVTGDDGRMYAWCVQINYGAASYSGDPLGVSSAPQANSNLGYTLTLLWNKTLTNPLYGQNVTLTNGGSSFAYSFDDQVFCIFVKETQQWFGYSLATGNILWGPTTSMGAWDMYGGSGTGTSAAPVIADGTLLMGGFAGILYAYNDTTGNILWTYTAPNIGGESPYGNYPLTMGPVCDGNVYVYSTEHSPVKPLWRGSMIRDVNITSGQLIWAIQDYVGWTGSQLAVADGYMVGGNMYDNMVYCYGMGPSATTISAPSQTSTLGTPVLIQGTVTDQSPGALGASTRSTKGTPCVSDDSMQQWMQYIYMQQPLPTNVTGVPVTLTYIDPNNNTGEIGTTATIGSTGHYSISWTPQIPGVYTITATFCGTNSYGTSSALTSLDVSNAGPTVAPTASPQANLATTSDLMTYIAVAVIAIIIAIAIVGLLLLRKHA